jgi:tRNA(Ile)-lysidine synthase
MIDAFKSFVKEQQLFDFRSRVLVGVSGGRDSVVLTRLLKEAGYVFSVAHCNFQLRGKESDEEELFVQRLAAEADVPFFVKHFETQEYASQNKISIQMAARNLRYDWFHALCATHGFDCIAVAHHLDDQYETFFINLIRGSGLTGLKGMKTRNGLIVRPMLFASSEQITAYAKANNIPYKDDSSNTETKYLRNKIRHSLLPVFYALHENSRQGLQKSLHLLAGNHLLYEDLIKDKTEQLLEVDGDVRRIEKAKIMAYNAADTLLYGCIARFGFSGSIVSEIWNSLFSQPGSVFYASDYRLTVGHSHIEITALADLPNDDVWQITDETKDICLPVHLKFEKIEKDSSFSIKSSPDIAQLDFEKIVFPLSLRRWRTGDRFIPLGMKGTKLLSDFFVDKHFSQLDKEQALLLLSGNGDIIWLVGHRIDDRYKVEDETKQILRIKIY